jgi:acyl carrier protein
VEGLLAKMVDQETLNAVRQAVVEALGVSEDEVQPGTTLMDELGAESIDLLDVLFRLERKLGVKVKAADIAAWVQGDIPEGEFGGDDGKVTPAALAQLKRIMPQVDFDGLNGQLETDKVMMLFTVENLAELVMARVATAAR